MRQITTGIITLALTLGLCFPHAVRAQHAHSDMEIASTADSGGDLAIEFNFETIIRTDYNQNIGPVALYTTTNPGFATLETDEPGEGLYVLDAPTTVDMTLITIDDNLSLNLNGTPMASAGDSANIGTHDGGEGLHKHPVFQIFHEVPEGEFAEGQFSFVLEDVDANNPAYGMSEIYTMQVTNGYLPEFEDGDPKDLAKCQSTIGKNVAKLINKQYKLLTKCLDPVQAFKLDGGDLETPSNKVAGKCSIAKVVDPLAAERAKALDKSMKKCEGIVGSVAVSSHLAMAECRVEELIGAAYGTALEDFAVLLYGDDEEMAEAEFPCIAENTGETTVCGDGIVNGDEECDGDDGPCGGGTCIEEEMPGECTCTAP